MPKTAPKQRQQRQRIAKSKHDYGMPMSGVLSRPPSNHHFEASACRSPTVLAIRIDYRLRAFGMPKIAAAGDSARGQVEDDFGMPKSASAIPPPTV